MKPKSRGPEQDDLLRPRLTDMIDMRHELVKLAGLIDWAFFETEWAGFFPSHTGRPATSPRLVAGLLYLQHTYRLSDEAVLLADDFLTYEGAGVTADLARAFAATGKTQLSVMEVNGPDISKYGVVVPNGAPGSDYPNGRVKRHTQFLRSSHVFLG